MIKRTGIISRERVCVAICSLFIAVWQVIGYVFLSEKTEDYLFGSKVGLFDMVSHLLIYFLVALVFVVMVFYLLDYLNKKKNINECRLRGYGKKELTAVAGIFFVGWLPYYFIFYPGTNAGDTTRQILMFFHMPTRVAGKICTDGISVIYNTHHPLFTTWVYGVVCKIGIIFGGGYETGLAWYTVFKMIMFAVVFTAMIFELRKNGVHRLVCTVILIYLALSPNIAMFVITSLSDREYALAMVIMLLLMIKIVQSQGSVLHSIRFNTAFLISLLYVCLTKKPGVYVVGVILLIMMYAIKKYRKQCLFLGISIILLFHVGYEGLLYKALNVQAGGKQEMLSVPFQQTARYLRDYSGEISGAEYEAINKVLNVEKIIENYNPEISDNVKNTYRREASRNELMEYFKVWASGLWKAPDIYIAATLNNTYGYFVITPKAYRTLYFDLFSTQKFYDNYNGFSEKMGIETDDYAMIRLESPARLERKRDVAKQIIKICNNLPVVGEILSIGFSSSVLIILISYCISRKLWKEFLLALIPFLNLAVCLISPVNGSYRYALPMILTVPFLFGIVSSKIS